MGGGRRDGGGREEGGRGGGEKWGEGMEGEGEGGGEEGMAVQSGLCDGQAVCLCGDDGAGSGCGLTSTWRDSANSFVTDYGVKLLPALYEKFNPMPYKKAQSMEVELAIALQRLGYGVGSSALCNNGQLPFQDADVDVLASAQILAISRQWNGRV